MTSATTTTAAPENKQRSAATATIFGRISLTLSALIHFNYFNQSDQANLQFKCSFCIEPFSM